MRQDSPSRRTEGKPIAGEPKLRVLVVDDHEQVRESLKRVLAEYPELEVVGEAANGAQGLERARSFSPDVVVMDMAMPVLDGETATRLLHAEMPHVQVFAFSADGTDRIRTLQQAGASGCFNKPHDLPPLVCRLLEAQASRVKQ